MLTATTSTQGYADLRAAEGVIDQSRLAELWAGLAPAGLDDMLGLWQGGLFDTGHPFNNRPAHATWYGKDIRSIEDARPDVCVNSAGKLYASESRGTLWMIEFRGEVTAALVYDSRPVIDHFKIVDPDIRLGVMSRTEDRAEDRWLYFWLERSSHSYDG